MRQFLTERGFLVKHLDDVIFDVEFILYQKQPQPFLRKKFVYEVILI